MYLLGVLLGKLVGTFQKHPLFTCRVWAGRMGGYFLKVPTIYLLGMSWANCFRTHNELTMYPLGILPFAPSECSLFLRTKIGRISLDSRPFEAAFSGINCV